MASGFDIIVTAFNSLLYDIFVPLDGYFNILNTAMLVLIIFSTHRFLLVPILGGSVGSSDKAKKVSKQKNSDSTEVSIIG